MPTDASAGDGPDLPTPLPEDQLTFEPHDFGRDRPRPQPPTDLGFAPTRPAEASPAPPGDDGFAPTRQAEASPAPPGDDGFVIRQPQSVAPAAPVDALVVGAPEPAVASAPGPEPPPSFRISGATTVPSSEELWTTRAPAAAAAPVATTQPSRRGWSTRHIEVLDRSASATMLRLREEAVNVSWRAAWIAVTSANPRLLRKRRAESR